MILYIKLGVKSINILLDEDDARTILYYIVQFQNQGITTKNIKPSDKVNAIWGFLNKFQIKTNKRNKL